MTQARGQLHRLPAGVPAARPGLPVAASFRRSCRSSSWSLAGYVVLLHRSVDRPRARTRSASRRPARATPASRWRGASALVYVLSGVVAEPRGGHLRRAPRPGAVRRRHRLRARRDHGGRARRHVGLRRPRHALGHAARPVRRSSVLQNGLQLAALPSELTGVLTGVAAGRRRSPLDRVRAPAPRRAAPSISWKRRST